MLVVSAVLGAHRAASAADLAALAAAGAAARAEGERVACAAAAGLARRNGAVLERCRVGTDGSATVEVVVAVAGLGGARATARAGPVSARLPAVWESAVGSGAQDGTQQGQGAGLVQRLVAVAALGDWTHDGHPRSHRHASIASAVASSQVAAAR